MIAAALSLQDPRERPAELQAQADQQHARFKAEGSDFLTWLNLWRYLKEQQRELSSSAFRRMCKREFLNYLRVREWQDFESQLRQVCKEMEIKVGRPADVPDADGIHQSLLAGLLSHIGLLEERDKETVRRPAPDARVPRRPRRAVRDLPGQRAGPEEPAVPDGRRAGRDLAAVGPAERRDQAGVGRGARRAPGEAHLLRAALVEEAGLGDGPRAGHAVRRAAGRRPAGVLRQGRRGAVARAVHPARAGLRRVDTQPATGSSRPTGGCSRRPRSSSTAPGAATSWSTSTPSSTSTTPGSAPTWSAARTSTSGGSRSGGSGPTCSPSTRRCSPTTRPRPVHRGRLPRGSGTAATRG